MSQPRRCGGGCCPPVVVEQPTITVQEESTPAGEPGKDDPGADGPVGSAHPVPEPHNQPKSESNCQEESTSNPSPQDQSTATSGTGAPNKGSPSCSARCCDDKGPSIGDVVSSMVPDLPVVDLHGGPGSPGPSSCQATICDDKCDHGDPSKQEPNDPSAPGRRKLVLAIQGMDCPSCSPRVVRALTSFTSVADCHVDVFAGRATVTYHPAQVNPDDMAGYVASSTGFQCQIEDDQVVGKAMRRMRVQLGMPLDGDQPKLNGVHVLEERPSGLVEVEYETELNPRDVLASFSPWNGVYVPPSRDSTVDSAQREVIRILILTVLSTLLTLPVLVLAWAPLPPHPTTYGAISLAMTTIIQIVVARPIYIAGISALVFQHTLDMDFLVSISIGTAYVFSTVAYAMNVSGHPLKDGESYFETAALLVTLIMLGRLIAAYARRRSTNAVAKLGSIQSDKATLVLDTRTRVIPIGLVHIGDILRVAPGDLVPTDGRVVRGEGYVDESSITGESVPVIKAQGAILLTGTVLTRTISNPAQPPLDMRVTVVPDGNTLARMAELMRAAQSARLRVQEITDRVAGWLAPVALTIALVAFVGWTGVGVRDV